MYKEIVYFIQNLNKGDLIYNKEKAIIGYYTGYGLEPTYKTSGYIECENCSGDTYFVSGLATYIKGFGVKFIQDYKIVN